MPRFSQTPAARLPVVVDGETYFKTDWMDGRGGAGPAGLAPSVYLVEQLPGVALRTHFHRNNQFQLFVRGSGMIGPHALSALTVHYAGAYSGYGPLVAGPGGLAYFTLRAVYETGSLTMKEHSSEMRRGPKRQMTSQPVVVADDAQLSCVKAAQSNELIAPQSDGIAARMWTLPAGTALVSGLDPSGAVGRFALVLAGKLLAADRTLHVWDQVFVAAGEPEPRLVAGDGGAQLVCLQLPHIDPAYL